MNDHPARPFFAVFLLALFFLAGATPSAAQDDWTAGLFTEARQLPLVSQSLLVRLADGEARFELVQVFANPGAEIGQADYRLHLPEGATVSSFGFWQGERFLAAELKEKEEAKSDHRRAAAEGRATALLEQKGTIHSFSVYPVAAGERKQVEITLRVPVTTESGRSVLKLPLDVFLGQAALTSTVFVHLETEEPLAAFGVDGVSAKTLARGERWASFAFSSRDACQLWWAEELPPLLTRAEAVPLDDGTVGLQVRVALNDAGLWRAPYERLVALVDASFSMRRRATAVAAALERLVARSPAPLRVLAVDETVRDLDARDAGTLLRDLLGGTGFAADWEAIHAAAVGAGCADPAVRCLVLTDPQLDGLPAERPPGLEVVFVADAHEREHFAKLLGDDALVYQEDEPRARLEALVDEAVLPTLEVVSIEQSVADLDFAVPRRWRVAEGGLLRLFARSPAPSPITLRLRVDGEEVVRTVDPEVLTPESRQGRAVRHGVYREVLAGWMSAWRRNRDPELKRQIVELSLAEGIPTAFTALHVADPELSLKAIKPGDPLLTVPGEPGLVEVFVFYPFGDLRRLVYDPERDEHSDRFLVPRGWVARPYRIDVFKRYEDGRSERAEAWYELDDRAPHAEVTYDAAHRCLLVDSGEETPAIAAVEVHAEDGRVLSLAPVDTVWAADATSLGSRFTVVLRDRAGNRRAYDARLEDGKLRFDEPPEPAGDAPALVHRPFVASGRGISVTGDTACLESHGRRFKLAGLALSSLDVGATLELPGGEVLVGTRGGDLFRLDVPSADGISAVHRLDVRLVHTPITGLALLPRGTVLVAVLGMGLFELEGDELRRSDFRVGTRFVTGIASMDGEVFVGTASNGLWRIHDSRAVKTRLPGENVSRLRVTPRGLVVEGFTESWLRRGRDRFTALGELPPTEADRDLTAAVSNDGLVLFGLFDDGLAVWWGDSYKRQTLPLTPPDRRINDLEISDGHVWMATEGGLLRFGDDGDMKRVLEVPVHGLATTPWGLVAAASTGLWQVGSDGRAERLGGQTPVPLSAVVFSGGELYAGGLSGLYRLRDGELERIGLASGFAGGWVTALLADRGRLFVGTYERGVWVGDGRRFEPIAGLQDQWVPPHALAMIDDTLWIGGLGMPPARLLADGTLERIAVPVRDTNGFVALPRGDLLLLTSDGTVRLQP